MSEKHDGGIAFPSHVTWQEWSESKADYVTRSEPVGGMSLRDYFAAKALQGMFACGGQSGVADEIRNDKKAFCMTASEIGKASEAVIAHMAYSMADAMLAEREK